MLFSLFLPLFPSFTFFPSPFSFAFHYFFLTLHLCFSSFSFLLTNYHLQSRSCGSERWAKMWDLLKDELLLNQMPHKGSSSCQLEGQAVWSESRVAEGIFARAIRWSPPSNKSHQSPSKRASGSPTLGASAPDVFSAQSNLSSNCSLSALGSSLQLDRRILLETEGLKERFPLFLPPSICFRRIWSPSNQMICFNDPLRWLCFSVF